MSLTPGHGFEMDDRPSGSGRFYVVSNTDVMTGKYEWECDDFDEAVAVARYLWAHERGRRRLIEVLEDMDYDLVDPEVCQGTVPVWRTDEQGEWLEEGYDPKPPRRPERFRPPRRGRLSPLAMRSTSPLATRKELAG